MSTLKQSILAHLSSSLPVMVCVFAASTIPNLPYCASLESVDQAFTLWLEKTLLPELHQYPRHSTDYPFMFHVIVPPEHHHQMHATCSSTLQRVMFPWSSMHLALTINFLLIK
jgi:hypothetical protein